MRVAILLFNGERKHLQDEHKHQAATKKKEEEGI